MLMLKESYPNFVSRLVKALNSFKVEYMIIGGVASIIQGFNGATQDIDIYVDKEKVNQERLIKVLEKLKFKLTDKDKESILRGKDFIQLHEPFEIDIVFAPDGFENYADAKKYKKEVGQFPVLSLDGIIKSKKSANRPKDRAVLQLLIDFNKYKNENIRYFLTDENMFEVPESFKIADYQTLHRWQLNEDRSIESRIKRGII